MKKNAALSSLYLLICSGMSFFLVSLSAAAAGEAKSAAWYEEQHTLQSKRELRSVLRPIIEQVIRTPTGSKLLARVKARDPDYLKKVQVGRVSQTETTYSRSFSLVSNEERVKIDKTLILRSRQNRQNMLFDFVHELTHYLEKVPKNPYDFSITAKQFIEDGIEGQGGELAAFAVECHVYQELKNLGEPLRHSLCDRFLQPAQGEGVQSYRFDKAAAKREFYFVGSENYPRLRKILRQVARQKSVFISSTGQASYPYSLLQEFRRLRETACANNKKKEHLIRIQLAAVNAREDAETESAGRGLASTRKKLSELNKTHCSTQ